MSQRLFITLLFTTLFLVGCQNQKVEVKPDVIPDLVTNAVEAEKIITNEDFSAKKYTLSTEESVMKWSAGKVVGSGYTGTMGLKEGQLMMDEAGKMSGEFVVDMNQMTNDQGKDSLISHLKNEDFFNVEKYPIATFKITDSNQVGDQYKVVGDLTILDQTHSIDFMASAIESKGQLKLETSFEIDRTKWGIRYGSANFFDDLGDKAIKNEIGYQLTLILN